MHDSIWHPFSKVTDQFEDLKIEYLSDYDHYSPQTEYGNWFVIDNVRDI